MKRPRNIRYLTVLSVALASVLVLGACSNSETNTPATKPSTIKVTLTTHPWTDAIEKLIPKFEAETGIKVDLTVYTRDQLDVKSNVQLNAGSSDLDVFMYNTLQAGPLYVQNGWMADLSKFIKDDPSFGWSDFQAGPREASTIDGKIYGVPINTDAGILFYNKKLLDAAGVAVPTTLKDLMAAAKALNKDGVAGIVMRGKLAQLVSPFSGFLYSYGGDFTDKSGNATLDTPEAIEAYKTYGSLLKDYGPKGVTDMGWPQAVPLFTSGKAAMYIDADSLFINMTDPAQSSIADSVGYASVPAGPAGSVTFNVPAWGLGINQGSKNKDAAWKFIEWASSKATTLITQGAGVPGARTSAWASKEGTKAFPPELLQVLVEAQKTGVGHNRPEVVDGNLASEIVSGPIIAAINGGDVEAAAKKAQADLEALIAKDKKK